MGVMYANISCTLDRIYTRSNSFFSTILWFPSLFFLADIAAHSGLTFQSVVFVAYYMVSGSGEEGRITW